MAQGGGARMTQGSRGVSLGRFLAGLGVILGCGTVGCIGTDKPINPTNKLLSKTQQPGPGLPGTPMLPGAPSPGVKTTSPTSLSANPNQPSSNPAGSVTRWGNSATQQNEGSNNLTPTTVPNNIIVQPSANSSMPPQPSWVAPPTNNSPEAPRRGELPQVPLTDIYPPAPPGGNQSGDAPLSPIAPPVAPLSKGY